MKFAIIVGITLIASITASSVSRADTIFTYRGELAENGNLANGTYDMDFLLWDALAGGNQVGATITINGVQVTNGRFTVELDFGAAALDNTDRWLEVVVNGTMLAPRQPITRVPYAIQTRGLFVDDVDHVGIGMTNPLYPLHVQSDDSVTAAFSNTLAGPVTHYGVVAEVLADDGTAVWGTHVSMNGTAPAILGNSNSTADGAVGVLGVIESTTPGVDAAGVHGHSKGLANDGIGVRGSNDGFGPGVYGTSVEGDGVSGLASGNADVNFGVRGESRGFFGTGVIGLATAVPGLTAGVIGRSYSSDGTGVLGEHLAVTGVRPGVMGTTFSTSENAVGVYGKIDTGTPGSSSAAVRGENRGSGAAGIGVWGSQDGSGYGVLGVTPEGAGVYGFATGSTGVNFGVYGRSDSPSGYDFYAAGPGVDYGSSSSRRWKKNIANIDQPLTKLANLRGVYYDWDQEHGGQHDVGMIAEEVGEVLPEIVQYESNGIDAIGMDYSKLTPLLVEAVNALRAEKDVQIESLRAENNLQIESLRAEKNLQIELQSNRITQLQEENNKLHARLDALEALFSQSYAAEGQR